MIIFANMIQRIQHIYFFLIALIAIWFSVINICSFSLENISAQFKNIYATHVEITSNTAPLITEEYNGMLVSLILIALVSFVNIFMFKNRKLQEKIGYINYLAITAFIVLFIMKFLDNTDMTMFSTSSLTTSSWVNFALMFGMLFLNFLAINGIKADEELVRAADRIR